MKIQLIQPSELNYDGSPIHTKSAWFDDLTLAYLAALTPDDIEVETVVEKFDGINFDTDADLVGITAMGVSPMLRAFEIADQFRSRGVKVVLGGTNMSLYVEGALEHADSVVIGEADTIWSKVLNDCRQGSLQKVYRGEPLADLSGLPVPRYDLFNTRPEYKNALFTVAASRGCPHRCGFCAVGNLQGGEVRFRPIDDVIRDIVATGRKRIFFADDNMMSRPAYYKELFNRLIPLKIKWISSATLNIGRDLDMLKLARKSGCVLLILGMESLGQDNLNNMDKKFNKVHEYESWIKAIHDAGIIASCSTIFGFDGDDTATFDNTVDFFIRNKVKVAPLFLLTPVPGTRLWKQLKDENRITTHDWSRYDAVNVVFEPKHMSADDLSEGLLRAYQRLYGISGIRKRLFPWLGNPMADIISAGLNWHYFQLTRRNDFRSFNFN